MVSSQCNRFMRIFMSGMNIGQIFIPKHFEQALGWFKCQDQTLGG